ncbi:hypothetical protein CBR_g22922 [Chara braunii]|uniref:Uncharacterized protein n=1 Tax=Chara braunii TaxID=69332 RepID=A0A388L320_CHABU|nr:hypothetical protein CBR_g22922 [Chara braunii]|eukprot:GBG76704.1 hypothetical protein CBR_g22922 [Chara braunii]
MKNWTRPCIPHRRNCRKLANPDKDELEQRLETLAARFTMAEDSRRHVELNHELLMEKVCAKKEETKWLELEIEEWKKRLEDREAKLKCEIEGETLHQQLRAKDEALTGKELVIMEMKTVVEKTEKAREDMESALKTNVNQVNSMSCEFKEYGTKKTEMEDVITKLQSKLMDTERRERQTRSEMELVFRSLERACEAGGKRDESVQGTRDNHLVMDAEVQQPPCANTLMVTTSINAENVLELGEVAHKAYELGIRGWQEKSCMMEKVIGELQTQLAESEKLEKLAWEQVEESCRELDEVRMTMNIEGDSDSVKEAAEALESLRQKVQECESERKQVREELERLEAEALDMEGKLEERSEEIDMLRKKCEGYECVLAITEGSVKELQARLTTVEEERDELLESMRDEKVAMEELDRVMKKGGEREDILRVKVDELRNEVVAKVIVERSLRDTLASLGNGLQETRASLKEFKEEVLTKREAVAQAEEMAVRLVELDMEKASKEEEIIMVREEASSLQVCIDHAVEALGQARAQMELLEKRMLAREKCLVEGEDVMARVERERNELAMIAGDQLALIAQLQEDVQVIAHKIIQMGEVIVRLRKRLEEEEFKANIAAEKSLMLEDKVEQLEATVEEKSSRLELMNDKILQMEEDVEELTYLRKDKEKMEQLFNKACMELTEVQMELQNARITSAELQWRMQGLERLAVVQRKDNLTQLKDEQIIPMRALYVKAALLRDAALLTDELKDGRELVEIIRTRLEKTNVELEELKKDILERKQEASKLVNGTEGEGSISGKCLSEGLLQSRLRVMREDMKQKNEGWGEKDVMDLREAQEREVFLESRMAPMQRDINLRESDLQRESAKVERCRKELEIVRMDVKRKDDEIRKLTEMVQQLARVSRKRRQSEAERFEQQKLLADLGDALLMLEAKAVQAEEKRLARKRKFKAITWAMDELKQESEMMKQQIEKLKEEVERKALEEIMKDHEITLWLSERKEYEAENESTSLKGVSDEVGRKEGRYAAWPHGADMRRRPIDKVMASEALKTAELESVKQKLRYSHEMTQLMAEEVEEKRGIILKLEEEKELAQSRTQKYRQLREAEDRCLSHGEESEELKANICVSGEVLELQERQREELVRDCDRLQEEIDCIGKKLGKGTEERELLRRQVAELEARVQVLDAGEEERSRRRGKPEEREEQLESPVSATVAAGALHADKEHAQAQEQMERLFEGNAALTKDLAVAQSMVESQMASISKLEDVLQKKPHNTRVMEAAAGEKRRGMLLTKVSMRRAISMDMTLTPAVICETDEGDVTVVEPQFGMKLVPFVGRREMERKIKQMELELSEEREEKRRQVMALTDKLGQTKAELTEAQRQTETLLAKCEKTGVMLMRLAEEEKLFFARLKELQEFYNGMILGEAGVLGGEGDEEAGGGGDYVMNAFAAEVIPLRARITELEMKLAMESSMRDETMHTDDVGDCPWFGDWSKHGPVYDNKGSSSLSRRKEGDGIAG